jgi:hypothetical protein
MDFGIFSNWLFDVALILVLITAVAIKFGKLKLAFLTIGGALASFSTDLIAPPYSACSFAQPGFEEIAKQAQNVRLTDDIFSCNLAKIGWNFEIFHINFPLKIFGVEVISAFPVSIALFLFFGLLLGILVYLARLKNRKQYWISVFALAGFAIYFLYSIGNLTTNELILTSSAILTYLVIPLIMYFAGMELIAMSGAG